MRLPHDIRFREWPATLARSSISAIRTLEVLIFPALCPGCGLLLGPGEMQVCGACLRNMRKVSPGDEEYLRALETLRGGSVVDAVIVPFYFESGGPLQELVHGVKYSGMRKLGQDLGRLLGVSMMASPLFPGLDGLVPVPLHPVKCRERGYNQAECLCRGASEVTGLLVMTDLVGRRRYTRSQTTLSAAERKENVSGAFQVFPRAKRSVKGKILAVVDDVITTGATIDACAHALNDAGASGIVACALALAFRPSKGIS